jgi:hypothetical protein
MDAILSKKPLCESVTNQCVAVKDKVWDTFLREIAPALKSAELLAESDRRMNCIGNISACFQKGCKDTMDPNDPDGSYDLCLTRPEAMLNTCKVQLNECGISTNSHSEAANSEIWNFVVQRLAAMRVDSCTQSVKECLQSEDRCGKDYTQCVGLDTDSILLMCPKDKLLACYLSGDTVGAEDVVTAERVHDKIVDIIQGIILSIDNAFSRECQARVEAKMLEICGDGYGCAAFNNDASLGTESLVLDAVSQKEIVIKGLLDFSLIENVSNKAKLGSKTANLTRYVTINNSLSEFTYLLPAIDTNAGMEGNSETSSNNALNAIVSKINTVINLLSSDEGIKACTHGRKVKGVNERTKNTRTDDDGIVDSNNARFPSLLDSYVAGIISDGVSKAKENYIKKLEQLKKEAQIRVDEILAKDPDAGFCI